MNCRIILVRPHFAANVGAAARVLRNLGASELVLIAPAADPRDPEARRLAAHAGDVLDRCRVVADLGEAAGDCVFVAGTSARVGGLMRRQSVGTPEEVLARLADAMTAGPTALVFGPEADGLTTEETSRCHWLIHIPADPVYPVLNLAQAVAVCLYELRRQWLRRQENPLTPLPQGERGESTAPAPFVEQERMFAHLRESLEQIHFLWDDKADALMHVLRHLIGRAGPTLMEVGVLEGLARQIRWYVAHHPPTEKGG
ncbi:MAG TPA: RNA methyltransferase [Gemmataceae bacterium]|nr:RNA methyltransferase [Gemmataceae bacterium]